MLDALVVTGHLHSAMPRTLTLLASLALLLLLSGCMRYHDQALRDLQMRQCDWSNGMLFEGRAYYTSRGGHAFPYEKLSAVFGSYDKRIAG